MARKITTDQRLEIDNLYAIGMPTSEIASKYNVHTATILLYITHKSKIKSTFRKSKTKKYIKDEDVIKMRELFSLGFDYLQIAELINFSVQSVMSNVIVGTYDLVKKPKRNIVTIIDFKPLVLPENPILKNAPTQIEMCASTTDKKAYDYMITKF